MTAANRPLFSLAFLLLCALFGSVYTSRAATTAQRINIPETGVVVVDDDDDETPEVTDRVARVSFLEGSAKIRRAESNDWEAVTLNLPLVEGDEIATDKGARLEIQLGKSQRVRLAENSSLRIVTLRDDGVALSLSLGTLTAHLDGFDKGKAFFEIDGPKTTVAVEKPGTFRIDAGQDGDQEVRVAATDGGEARVYSGDAGFTLKNGRSTRVAVAGATAGEWQTADAATLRDEFDAWSSGRDLIVAQQLRQAYYDKYYDDDIYGADDLNDYGDWVNTKNYGWVWRPSRSAISGYADWSPYRYGHWRWMPPFGWVWVNDEPWGWATYHHGRWVYDNGYWVWSPYGYYRPSRSWWFPALVVINVIDTNICWYPVSYHDHCRWDYWGHHHDRDRDRDRGGHGNGPPPGPVAGGGRPDRNHGGPDGLRNKPGGPGARGPKPPQSDVPPGAVVGVGKDEFVARVRGGRRMPPELIKQALERAPARGELIELAERLPEKVPTAYRTGAPSREAIIERRRAEIGAAQRDSGAALDESLQKNRVFGGRTPKPAQQDLSRPEGIRTTEPRSTGAVERDSAKDHRERQAMPKQKPGTDPGDGQNNSSGGGNIRPMPAERETKPREQPPVRTEPVQREPRPQPREVPRSEPPTRQESPPQPRSEPREQPRPQPQPRQEPRSEPKSEPKRETPAPQPKPDGDRPVKKIDD